MYKYQPLLSNYSEPTPSYLPPNPQAAQTPAGQITCAGCRILLQYPSKSLCVECPSCQTITAVQEVAQANCSNCQTRLMFPINAPCVACPCGFTFYPKKS